MKPSTGFPNEHLMVFAEIIIRAQEGDDKLCLVRAVHKKTGLDTTLLCISDHTTEGVSIRPIAIISDAKVLASEFFNPDDDSQIESDPNLN